MGAKNTNQFKLIVIFSSLQVARKSSSCLLLQVSSSIQEVRFGLCEFSRAK
jgi:hypothetical protein